VGEFPSAECTDTILQVGKIPAVEELHFRLRVGEIPSAGHVDGWMDVVTGFEWGNSHQQGVLVGKIPSARRMDRWMLQSPLSGKNSISKAYGCMDVAVASE